jgi:hypothetical protein
MAEPGAALTALATLLRDEGSVISPHATDPAEEPILGPLAAAGPRTQAHAAEYAFIVEAVREGYELHYGTGRVISGADRDLELLAGDYLYAIGLERLATLGDLDAVRELSDLISLAARVHDRAGADDEATALWIAATTAIAAGSSDAHEQAKSELRSGADGAVAGLRAAAEAAADAGGFTQALGKAVAQLDSRPRVG